jgi:hypothetical protein
MLLYISEDRPYHIEELMSDAEVSFLIKYMREQYLLNTEETIAAIYNNC